MRALKGLQSLGRGSKIRDRKMLANKCLRARETVSFQIQVGCRREQLGSDLHYLTISQTGIHCMWISSGIFCLFPQANEAQRLGVLFITMRAQWSLLQKWEFLRVREKCLYSGHIKIQIAWNGDFDNYLCCSKESFIPGEVGGRADVHLPSKQMLQRVF